MRTNDLLNLKKKCSAGTISEINNILSKRIFFPLILLTWSHFGRWRWRFLDFRDQSRITNGLFSNDLVERTIVLVLLPFTELARRFDEALYCCEASSPIRSYLWIFSLGFSSLRFSFRIFFFFLLMKDTSIYRWR